LIELRPRAGRDMTRYHDSLVAVDRRADAVLLRFERDRQQTGSEYKKT
jgi:hypothetical protein